MFLHHYPITLRDGETRYTVAFNYSKSMNADAIRKWCYQTYGPPGFNHLTYEIRWTDSVWYGEINFARESDMTLFILKWS